ncbi:putative membrane protein [Helicobacter pylori Hp A-6]|nr:putative membrane protein [Helicobacter pylori Hp A-6]
MTSSCASVIIFWIALISSEKAPHIFPVVVENFGALASLLLLAWKYGHAVLMVLMSVLAYAKSA